MANGHGGARRGAGRPMGRRNLRPHGALLAVERAEQGLIPVKFEGDSLDFMRATMQGKIWPTREQIYAAKSVLPIEHPAAVTGYGRDGETGRKKIGQEFAEKSRDDLRAGLIEEIRRICKADRENTTLDERIRRSIELDLVEFIKDEEPDQGDEKGIRAALSDLDASKLDRLVDLIKELWPTYCVLPSRSGELIPPPPSAVAKKTPSEPVIDHLANDGAVNGAELADVGRTVSPPQSNKPWDEPTSGNYAVASSEHISTASQPNNPGQQREPAEPEMLVPTRGPNGIR
jgi:hypothetical protein